MCMTNNQNSWRLIYITAEITFCIHSCYSIGNGSSCSHLLCVIFYFRKEELLQLWKKWNRHNNDDNKHHMQRNTHYQSGFTGLLNCIFWKLCVVCSLGGKKESTDVQRQYINEHRQQVYERKDTGSTAHT